MWRCNAVRRSSAGGGSGSIPYQPPASARIAMSIVWPISFKNARELANVDGRVSLNELKRKELERVAQDPAYMALSQRAARIAKDLKLPMLHETKEPVDYELQLTPERLQLKALQENYTPNIYADFDAYWKRRASYTIDSPLVRSVTVPSLPLSRTSIVDATGGLARDAFIIAAFGARVAVVERNPIIYALLADGIKRVTNEEAKAVLGRMAFLHGDSLALLPRVEPAPDVIYLDPMFTWPKGTMPKALPRKEMLISRRLVGPDEDSVALLGTALACAKRRVVYKQPLVAARPEGAVGEIKSANYRFAIFSAVQAREGAHERLRAKTAERRMQEAEDALAAFMAKTSETDEVPSATSSSTSSVSDAAVGRAAEETPIIPSASAILSAPPSSSASDFTSSLLSDDVSLTSRQRDEYSEAPTEMPEPRKKGRVDAARRKTEKKSPKPKRKEKVDTK